MLLGASECLYAGKYTCLPPVILVILRKMIAVSDDCCVVPDLP